MIPTQITRAFTTSDPEVVDADVTDGVELVATTSSGLKDEQRDVR